MNTLKRLWASPVVDWIAFWLFMTVEGAVLGLLFLVIQNGGSV